MPATDHPIFERLGIVIPGGHGEASAALNDQLTAMLAAMDEYQTSLTLAENVSGDYREEVRAAKQHELVDKARQKLLTEIDRAGQTLQATASNLAQEIAQATAPTLEDDKFDRLLAFMRLESIKRDFARLDPAEKRKALMASAQVGDRTLITACESSLIPLIDGNLLNSAKEVFAEVVAAGPLENLKITKHYLGKLKSTGDAIGKWADRQLGNCQGILARPTGTPAGQMTDSEKISFINQYGLQAWNDLLYHGKRPPQATTEEIINQITGE